MGLHHFGNSGALSEDSRSRGTKRFRGFATSRRTETTNSELHNKNLNALSLLVLGKICKSSINRFAIRVLTNVDVRWILGSNTFLLRFIFGSYNFKVSKFRNKTETRSSRSCL